MGPLACLLSAVGFGVMAVFAKLAYDAGVAPDSLLLVRFGIASLVLLAVVHHGRRFRGIGRRAVLAGLLMGAIGYAAQSGLYFSALTRIDASQAALLLCVYPVLVMLGAVATGRDRWSLPRCAALGLSLVGVVLVLGAADPRSLDVLGAALAIGAALVYSVYILVGDRVATTDPIAFTALVCCGAFATFAAGSLVRGTPDLGFGAEGWLWLVLIALVSTVGAILLFFAGLPLVGPTVASLLSLVEPVVTVTAAAVVFGESLTARQALGGALVIAAVALARLPARRTVRAADVRAPDATPVAAAP